MEGRGLDHFDAILYINLDFRQDRKALLLSQLDGLGIDPSRVYRIDAHYDKLNGARGCALSHIKALDFAIKKGFKHVLILEDDAKFLVNRDELDREVSLFIHLFQDAWDVFFLGTDIRKAEETSDGSFLRVTKSWCAHSYGVAEHYLTSLLACFWASYETLKHYEFSFESHGKAIDGAWQFLQERDRWYISKKLLVTQEKMKSDIDQTEKWGDDWIAMDSWFRLAKKDKESFEKRFDRFLLKDQNQ